MLLLHEFEALLGGAVDSNNGFEMVTVGLIDHVPVYCDGNHLHQETQPFAQYIRNYPDINNITSDILATRESAQTIGGGGGGGDLFLPVEDSAIKKIASVWREKGLVEAIRAAAAAEDRASLVHFFASKMTTILDFFNQQTSAAAAAADCLLPSIGSSSSSSSPMDSMVRCLAWHPHCSSRLALATRDDRIRIYSVGNCDQGVPAVLRHGSQKSVCSMSWRPHSGRELAAACRNGVLVWTVELGAASNSLSHATLLRQRNHAPVTGITWHPQGDLLVSSSPNDLNIIVWDVSKEAGVPLKRLGGGGQTFVRWSPCGTKLFAATCRSVFRVWNTGGSAGGGPWSVERWTVPSGRVTAACFGPHQTLLFASTEDPATLFSLPLRENILDVSGGGGGGGGGGKTAIPLIDLAKTTLQNGGGGGRITIGGKIVAMDWDPSGSFLAIIFQNSPLVTVFRTSVCATARGLTEILPACIINGFTTDIDEIPNCLQFNQNPESTTMAALLTIAWSSGRVQQFPIV